jgi:serine/threonine protein kinase
MTEPASSPPMLRLETAVVEFLERIEQGEEPDRSALLARYPDVAGELAEFFGDFDRLDGFARPPPTTDVRLEPTVAHEAGVPGGGDATWRTNPSSAATVAWRIGPYEIIEEIGRGGMGVVYKARHLGLKRLVALKTILAGQMASAEDRSRFRAEALAAAKLSHPGIVPIFEVGEAAGQPYLAMPLVEGQSLAQLLRAGPLPPATAARLLGKIVAAVAYAHDSGVIHRDLKPGNILLAAGESSGSGHSIANSGEAWEPRITDFGLAKRLDADELTTTGQILGTPTYMSPEQASGRRHEVGPAADIYSLGAILYAMLTGRPPFVSENPIEVILQVIEREPPLPTKLQPGVPRELEWICLKCLEKKPVDRYPSAAELAADLDRYLRREPPAARRPTLNQRLRRWIRQKPLLAAHLIGLAVPLIVGQFIFAFHPGRELVYHLELCGVIGLWMIASVVCQWLMERQRTRQWPLYLWATADPLLLTATIGLMKSPLGVFVGGYMVLIAVSGMSGKTRLVAFTTASSLLGYLAFLVLRPEEARPPHYAIFAAANLALSGLAVGYQVWRMSVLREYYGEKPLG